MEKRLTISHMKNDGKKQKKMNNNMEEVANENRKIKDLSQNLK